MEKSEQVWHTQKISATESGDLRSADVYFFDLDGCIYHTNQPALGAKDLLDLLKNDGKQVGFITNNSRETSVEIAAKLHRMGFQIQPQEIITATEAVGSYLKEQFGSISVKVVGSHSLEHSIAEWGHTVLKFDAVEKTDVIVVGRDTEFTFQKLQQVIDQSDAGVRIVTTNPDLFHPGPQGRKIVETGALSAAINAIIAKPLEFVGKPDPFLFQYALRVFGLTTQKCVMIGDNLSTDIVGGYQAGMMTVWISGPDWYPIPEQFTNVMDIRVDGIEALLSYYRNQ